LQLEQIYGGLSQHEAKRAMRLCPPCTAHTQLMESSWLKRWRIVLALKFGESMAERMDNWMLLKQSPKALISIAQPYRRSSRLKQCTLL
jgi:hypothetical protein